MKLGIPLRKLRYDALILFFLWGGGGGGGEGVEKRGGEGVGWKLLKNNF